MCAIMGFSTKKLDKSEIPAYFDRTVSRGPDMSKIMDTGSGWLCFHRLAIMGLTEAGMQPFELDGDMVVCNGELYGFRPLKRQLTERELLADRRGGEMTLYTDVAGAQTETKIPIIKTEGKVFDGLFYKKIRSFLDAIKEGKPAPVPSSQILYNQAIIDGIVKSAELGREIEINIPEI